MEPKTYYQRFDADLDREDVKVLFADQWGYAPERILRTWKDWFAGPLKPEDATLVEIPHHHRAWPEECSTAKRA